MTDTLNELDSFENDALPEVKIRPSPSVEFGTISYLRPETQSIEVVNVGSVIAQWSFVLRPGATALTAPWLSVTPTSGLILPGEKSLVNFTIIVDAATAPRLNFAARPEDELSDLLILSIDKRDLFLSVSAREYERTCFANSLVRLGRLLDPIREVKGKKLEVLAQEADAAVDGEGEEKMSVVRPAFRMLEFLAEYGLEDEELFLMSGNSELVDLIHEALDTVSRHLPLFRHRSSPSFRIAGWCLSSRTAPRPRQSTTSSLSTGVERVTRGACPSRTGGRAARRRRRHGRCPPLARESSSTLHHPSATSNRLHLYHVHHLDKNSHAGAGWRCQHG